MHLMRSGVTDGGKVLVKWLSSPWFDRLLTHGKLRDSAVGRGLTPTWSSGPWWLPLDHILVGEKCEVLERRVNEDRLGSDHFPVIATLRLSGRF
jgi:endonuclease/exonuclease/phosphatase family metal-dependent hydrolase